jgi:cytochrome c biogenesis protein CcdA
VIEGDFAYSLLLGMLAAVNPCGFVLLPTYLLAYLGVDDDATATSRLRRSLLVGGSISGGFVAVFVVVGAISRLFTNWLAVNAKYAALVIGIALIFMGVRMLTGWRPRLWVPSLGGGSGRRSVIGMAGFGVVYAVASIGCTIGLLTTAVFGSFARDGVLSGIVSVALYGVGMGLFVTALTASLAFAKNVLVSSGRRLMRWTNRLSSVLVLITGVYLTWYWYVAITQQDDPGALVEVVGRWQSRLAEQLVNIGSATLLVVFGATIIIALLLALRRRDDSTSRVP